MVVVVLTCLGILCIFPVRSNDLFFYLEIGRRFFTQEGLPKTDIFLFTGANARFDYYHELGSMISFYVVYFLGGFNALIFAKAALFLVMGSLPLWVAQKLDEKRFSYFLPVYMFFAFYGASGRLIERGSIFSDLFSTLIMSLIIVIRAKVGAGTMYKMCIPLVFLVWINFHAGFVLGFMLLLVWLFTEAIEYGVCDSSKKAFQKAEMYSVLKTIGASLFLGMINPRGVNALLMPLRIMGDESLQVFRRFNTEYLSPLSEGYRSAPDMMVFVGVVLVCFLILVVSTGKLIAKKRYRDIPIFETSCFCILAVFGLSMVRFVNTVSFGMAVLVASLLVKNNLLLNDESVKIKKSRLLFPLLALGGIVLFFVAGVVYGYGPSLEKRKIGLGVDLADKPEKACVFIDQNRVNVNIFNQYDFGAYMIWRWQGRVKVFYHGFVDDIKYFLNNYAGINRSEEDFIRIVQTYGIGAFLVRNQYFSENAGPSYLRRLRASREWHLVYMDDVAMLFVKDIPENREIIEKYSGRRYMTKSN